MDFWPRRVFLLRPILLYVDRGHFMDLETSSVCTDTHYFALFFTFFSEPFSLTSHSSRLAESFELELGTNLCSKVRAQLEIRMFKKHAFVGSVF